MTELLQSPLGEVGQEDWPPCVLMIAEESGASWHAEGGTPPTYTTGLEGDDLAEVLAAEGERLMRGREQRDPGAVSVATQAVLGAVKRW